MRGFLLNRERTNKAFESMMRYPAVVKSMKLKSLSQIWRGKRFLVCVNADLKLQVRDIIVVADFEMNCDGVTVTFNKALTGKSFTAEYIPKAISPDILVSVPSQCIITKQVWQDKRHGLYRYRLCAGVLWHQRSDPANKKPYPAVVEESRFKVVYGPKESKRAYDDFIASIT